MQRIYKDFDVQNKTKTIEMREKKYRFLMVWSEEGKLEFYNVFLLRFLITWVGKVTPHSSTLKISYALETFNSYLQADVAVSFTRTLTTFKVLFVFSFRFKISIWSSDECVKFKSFAQFVKIWLETVLVWQVSHCVHFRPTVIQSCSLFFFLSIYYRNQLQITRELVVLNEISKAYRFDEINWPMKFLLRLTFLYASENFPQTDNANQTVSARCKWILQFHLCAVFIIIIDAFSSSFSATSGNKILHAKSTILMKKMNETIASILWLTRRKNFKIYLV